MNDLLDYIVSTTWAFMLTFILVSFIPAIVIIKRPFKNLFAARATQIVTSLGAFAFLMYLLMGPHGYAVQFIEAKSNGNQVCLVEFHYSGDGDGGTYENYRLYVVDAKTGDLILRKSIDSPELLIVKEKSAIFFEWQKAVEYDLFSGDIIHEYSKEKGFEKYTELAVGIEDMNRINSPNNQAQLTLLAKNGKEYTLDLNTDELIEGKPPTSHQKEKYHLDEYSITYKDSLNHEVYISFSSTQGKLEKLKFSDHYSEGTLSEDEYIFPDFVSVHPELNLFVFKHYRTTDKTEAIFTAMGFDKKMKWEISQSDLKTKDKITDQPLHGITLAFSSNLYLTFGGQVVAVNAADGTLLWRKSY